MRTNTTKTIFTTLLLATLSTASLGVETTYPKSEAEELISLLKSQKAYTLAIMNQMPEEKFNYRPTDGVRSFGELFKHMIGSTNLINRILLREFTSIDKEYPASIATEKSNMTKAQTMAAFTQSTDSLIKSLGKMKKSDFSKTFHFVFLPDAPTKTNTEIINSIRDHWTHHRAQATVYLRLNGIKPSPYVPW